MAALAKIYKEADEKFPGIITRATAPGAILPTIRPSTQQQERVLPSIEQPIQPAVRFSTARDPPLARPPLRDDSHDLYNDDPRPPRNLNRASYHEREQSTPSQSRFPITLPNVSGRNNLQTAPLVQTAPIIPLVAPTSVQSTYDSGRAIINLMKIYDDRSKYHGAKDVWDIKELVFRDLCRKAGVREDDFHLAFSAMLSGDAQDFYLENLVERNLGFQIMAELTKE